MNINAAPADEPVDPDEPAPNALERKPKAKKGPPSRLETRRRERQAVNLYHAKVGLEEIAEQCGYASSSGAYKAIRRVLERESATSARYILEDVLSELNVMQRAIWRGVLEGDLETIDRALKIVERRAKLVGLDKTQITLTGPDDGPIQAQVVADVREFVALLALVAPDLPAVGEAPRVDGEAAAGPVLSAPTNGKAERVPPELPA